MSVDKAISSNRSLDLKFLIQVGDGSADVSKFSDASKERKFIDFLEGSIWAGNMLQFSFASMSRT